MKRFIFVILFGFFGLSGCFASWNTSLSIATEMVTSTKLEQVTRVPTRTETSTASPTREPTRTPSPTPKVKIEFPVSYNTPLPDLNTQINAENVIEIKEVAYFINDKTSNILETNDRKKKIIFYTEGIRIIDTKTSDVIEKISHRPYTLHRDYPPYIGKWVSISADGSRLAMLREDLTIVVIDDKGNMLATIARPKGNIYEIFLTISPDGKFVAIDSTEVDQFMKLYDIDNQAYVNLPQYNTTMMKFSSDSKYLYFYEFWPSWSEMKLRVLALPDWKLTPRTDEMTEFTELQKAIGDDKDDSSSGTAEYLIQPNENYGNYFWVEDQNSQPIIKVSSEIWDDVAGIYGSVYCENAINSNLNCELISDSWYPIVRKFLLGGKLFTTITEITKVSPMGHPKEGLTTIYEGTIEGENIFGTIPDFAEIQSISEAYKTVFYVPVDEAGIGNNKRQAAYYDLIKQQMFASFDKAKDGVYSFMPPGSPYAITIIDNYATTDDMFNVMFLDGSRENFAGKFAKTANNNHLIFSMSDDNSFFVVASALRATKKDGYFHDHIKLNIVHMDSLKDQIVYELPPIQRPSIPDYNFDPGWNVVRSIKVSPDNKMAVLGLLTGEILFVSLEDGVVLHRIQASIAGIQALTFSQDGNSLVVIDLAGSIKVFGILPDME